MIFALNLIGCSSGNDITTPPLESWKLVGLLGPE